MYLRFSLRSIARMWLWLTALGAAILGLGSLLCSTAQTPHNENTRELDCLAVHGINNETSEEDLRIVFPRAKHVIVAVRGGSAFLKYEKEEECIVDFIESENIEVKGVSVVVMFGHNVVDIEMAKKGSMDDLRGKLTPTRNKERWEPFLQFYKIKKMQNGDVADQGIDDNPDLLEVLFSCNLRPERMKMEVIRAKGKEEKRFIKTKWLDSLVGRALQKGAVTGHEARVFSRGEFRELVEDIWIYLVKGEDDILCGDSKEGEERIRNESRSQGHRKKSLDYTERDEKTRKTLKRESSQSSSEASSRNSNRRSKTKLSRRVNYEDGSAQQQKNWWEYSSDEMNNNEGIKGYMTPTEVVSESGGVYINSLGPYLQKKLLALGLKRNIVILEVDKMMVTLKQILESEGKVSFKQQEKMLHLLKKFGYKSGHVSDRLAADLVVEWAVMRKKDNVVEKLVKDADTDVVKDTDDDDDNMIPKEIMDVEEGYPRMAVVMAYVLHTQKGLEEQVSKDLARAMVGVWITYGFTYKHMCQICLSADREEAKVEVLRNMLENKLTEGFVKPMSFGFSKLIKLTLLYFAEAV